MPTIERGHEEWLADNEYRRLFECLSSFAKSLYEGCPAPGQWWPDD
jgi:hypothetical protein